ncbi:F-box/FBD/LRR-repeat protein At1g13570-like [Triticum dicoccoides]|uniref:F-box/FBD/LRR-repeat protein At1g13570-like n=1 Tax=Triticum dicoccoides TaxID=85692 RepID=UPI00188FBB16|nr:F-box/FBD/LRR-repeat protein At1g13570-like [Triticum dicoccoides]
MAEQARFFNMDRTTAADARCKGFDPHTLDQAAESMLCYIYANLPSLPVYEGTRLAASASPDGVDRISRLPPELLSKIVSRLPSVKDAARTAVLSSHWRRVWLSTPLVLSDAHLHPEAWGWPPTPASSPAVTAAVSRILEAHPGPFHCVHLVCSHMSAHRARLARWLQLLAAKGVQDLALVNRPWPRDVSLPPTLFAVTTLTRLYVGMWKLPGTAALRGASFPHLRELGLSCVEMEQGVVDSLVARSPALETLNILGCKGLRLRLVSQSLRCVQISCSRMEDIAVVKASLLERLILFRPCKIAGGISTRLRIGDAPKLQAFGYLEPGQVLKVRDTIIMPGIASASTVVTSVKILSLNVCFGVRSDVHMVPTFLRCFPNAERLHIMSKRCAEPTGNYLTLQFWEESDPEENLVSRISVMSFREFTGDPGEVGFLEFFFRSARALETASVSMANPSFTPFSTQEAYAKVKRSSRIKASESNMVVLGSTGPAGGKIWSLKDGADFSFHDPFSEVEVVG